MIPADAMETFAVLLLPQGAGKAHRRLSGTESQLKETTGGEFRV